MDTAVKKVHDENNNFESQKESFWSLENFKEKMLALKFARSIENIFSVYIDDPVNQIYTSYFLEVYTEKSISILLSTDPYSDAVFDGIPGECLKSSKLWIFPGSFFRRPKYKFVLAKMPDRRLTRPEKLILPSKMLHGLSADYFPVITNQDLCEFQQTTPCLNLQFIDVKKLRELGTLSPMKLNDLVHSMSEKINQLIDLGC